MRTLKEEERPEVIDETDDSANHSLSPLVCLLPLSHTTTATSTFSTAASHTDGEGHSHSKERCESLAPALLARSPGGSAVDHSRALLQCWRRTTKTELSVDS